MYSTTMAKHLYRVTVCDIVIHRNQYKINFHMARLSRGTNVHHTRAIVTTLLEFLSPLGLYYCYASL